MALKLLRQEVAQRSRSFRFHTLYPRLPPESGPGRDPLQASWGPELAPRLGLRSPGSPCRTASSAPLPTCCLPPSGLPRGLSEPEGPRKRQASGRRQTPRASAGPYGTASAALQPAPRPPRRRLSPSRARAARILHGNHTLPVPASAARTRAPPPRPRLRTRSPCRPGSARALRLRMERPPSPVSGPGRT